MDYHLTTLICTIFVAIFYKCGADNLLIYTLFLCIDNVSLPACWLGVKKQTICLSIFIQLCVASRLSSMNQNPFVLWYSRHGWLGVNNQLSIYPSIPFVLATILRHLSPWCDLRGGLGVIHPLSVSLASGAGLDCSLKSALQSVHLELCAIPTAPSVGLSTPTLIVRMDCLVATDIIYIIIAIFIWPRHCKMYQQELK